MTSLVYNMLGTVFSMTNLHLETLRSIKLSGLFNDNKYFYGSKLEGQLRVRLLLQVCNISWEYYAQEVVPVRLITQLSPFSS